jgi:hypothetical protein
VVSGDHTLEVELTEVGIASATVTESPLTVCPSLVSRQYRFAFWRLIDDGAVAVSFDISR